MDVQISYEIDRDEAIKAGKNEWGKFEIEIDPIDCPEHLRDELTRALNVPINACYIDSVCFSVKLIERADSNKIFEILQLRAGERVRIAEEKRLHEKECRRNAEKEFAARVEKIENAIAYDPDQLDLRDYPQTVGTKSLENVSIAKLSSETKHRLDIIVAKIEIEKRTCAENRRREIEDNTRREELRENLRAQTLRDAIATLADETDQARFADGTMTDEECIAYRSAWVFGDFGAKYEKIKASDFECDCCNNNISWDCDNLKKLSKEQWLYLRTLSIEFQSHQLGETIVAYKFTPRVHIGECECEERIERYSVIVEAVNNDIVFASRELALCD